MENMSQMDRLVDLIVPSYITDDVMDDCPHDEHDHGICLECGKDIWDDIVGAAEMACDAMEDR